MADRESTSDVPKAPGGHRSAAAVLLAAAGLMILVLWLDWPREWWVLIGIAAALGYCVWIVVQNIMRDADQQRVGRQARRRSQGLCESCGYDLRGAEHGKCPECGEAVK